LRCYVPAATAARADDEWQQHATALLGFWDCIEKTVAGLRGLDGTRAFDDATLFLRAFGHGVVAWLWLDQLASASPDNPIRVGIAAACRFFFDAELPQAVTWLEIVDQHSDLVREPLRVRMSSLRRLWLRRSASYAIRNGSWSTSR
jgi:hypothetical protein